MASLSLWIHRPGQYCRGTTSPTGTADELDRRCGTDPISGRFVEHDRNRSDTVSYKYVVSPCVCPGRAFLVRKLGVCVPPVTYTFPEEPRARPYAQTMHLPPRTKTGGIDSHVLGHAVLSCDHIRRWFTPSTTLLHPAVPPGLSEESGRRCSSLSVPAACDDTPVNFLEYFKVAFRSVFLLAFGTSRQSHALEFPGVRPGPLELAR